MGLCVENDNPMMLYFMSFRWLLRVEIRLLVECRSRVLAMLGGSLVLGNVSA